jgi:hypothetical protein
MGNRVLYISVPITSGRRFLEWYSEEGCNLNPYSDEYFEQKEKHVLIPNQDSSKIIIENIRQRTSCTVIDPSNLENTELKWEQKEFYDFWDEFISDCVDEVLFVDGWEYSIGCCYEFASAVEKGKIIIDQSMLPFSLEVGIARIRKSYTQYKNFNVPNCEILKGILVKLEEKLQNNRLEGLDCIREVKLKDEKLHELISRNLGNIAQYISFKPNGNLEPNHFHIKGIENLPSGGIEESIKLLINYSASKTVNIRSFSTEEMKGNKLIYGKKIEEIDEIVNSIKENINNGKYSIINENIDIKDGGVSGVVLGDVVEFSPEDTPKCVEKEGVCSLPRNIGIKILNTVYGFMPALNYDASYRVEFSIHPKRQGVLDQHTIIWEYEYYGNYENSHKIQWPNRFSRFLGDKVFGLLIADSLGFNVPKTTVLSRNVAPFTFGKPTGIYEKWIRTCPISKEPGKFYTGYGWVDPYELMENEEKKGTQNINIASVISQLSVNARYSGAAFVRTFEDYDVIEGVAGRGDAFMVGERERENLPDEVLEKVKELCNQVRKFNSLIGDVSIEWVYDGEEVWVVQMNQLTVESSKVEDGYRTIVKGDPSTFEKVYVRDGLDNLRKIIELSKFNNSGIDLIGNVGITSHFGDLLRLAGIPSRLINEM